MENVLTSHMCSGTFFQNMGYAAGKDGAPVTGVHLLLLAVFIINIFMLLGVSVASLCFVPPARYCRETKFSKLLSLLDLYAGFLKLQSSKKDKQDGLEFDKTKRSVSGAVMTLFTIVLLSGALLVLVKERYRFVPYTITESQELSSVLTTKSQYFKMVTVFKVDVPSQSTCTIFAQKAKMSVSGNDVTQVGNVNYKSETSDRYASITNCYVYQEWKLNAKSSGYQSPVNVSVHIGDSLRYSSASFAFVSLPWDSTGSNYWAKEGTLETQAPTEMVDYLKKLGGFCAQVQSGASSVSLTVEPKSFQYPAGHQSYRSSGNPIFSNIVHFPQQVQRWSSEKSQSTYDVTLDFTPRRAFYAEGQSSFNTWLIAGLTIVVVLLVGTWIKNVVMVIVSLCQKSLLARLLSLLGLFLISCGAYGVMIGLIIREMLFPDATISTLSLSGVIYTSLLLLSAFIHVVIYHSKYKANTTSTDELVSAFPPVQVYPMDFQSGPEQQISYPDTSNVPLYPQAPNPSTPLTCVYNPYPTYQ